MLEYHMHMQLERLNRELRDVRLTRPRLDRPEYRRHGTLRRLLGSLARPPAAAAARPGADPPAVTIRQARAADLPALVRLAELSERRVPTGPVLVAEVESRVVAALPVRGGPLLEDLLRPTGDVAQLLELRSSQVQAIGQAHPA
jgi:hypothetical protein